MHSIILALDVSAVDRALPELVGVAEKFRPHITLLGRCIFPDLDIEQEFLAQTQLSLRGLEWPIIEMEGPFHVMPTLVWFENRKANVEAQFVRELHCKVLSVAQEFGAADPRSGLFSGENYRPHMTFASGDAARSLKLERKYLLCVRTVALAVYFYSKDPMLDAVSRTELFAV